jgi:glucose dehydrogenase
MNVRTFWLGLAVTSAALLAACSTPAPEMKIGPDDWANPGGDQGKSHHSLLTDITPANIGTLGLAWAAELGTNRVLEATPVVIDGVMFTSGVAGRARSTALSAVTWLIAVLPWQKGRCSSRRSTG